MILLIYAFMLKVKGRDTLEEGHSTITPHELWSLKSAGTLPVMQSEAEGW